jgi:hypothetical protein
MRVLGGECWCDANRNECSSVRWSNPKHRSCSRPFGRRRASSRALCRRRYRRRARARGHLPTQSSSRRRHPAILQSRGRKACKAGRAPSMIPPRCTRRRCKSQLTSVRRACGAFPKAFRLIALLEGLSAEELSERGGELLRLEVMTAEFDQRITLIVVERLPSRGRKAIAQ